MKGKKMGNKWTAGRQKGFTLIELMIVFSFVAILATFAMPAYKDYSIRTKVSEASSIFATVKTAYGAYVSINGKLPSNLDQLKQLSSRQRDFSGDYIRWMRIQANGRVRARTMDISALGPAADKILEFRPVLATNGKSIDWTVFSRSGRDNWVPTKYLPSI